MNDQERAAFFSALTGYEEALQAVEDARSDLLDRILCGVPREASIFDKPIVWDADGMLVWGPTPLPQCVGKTKKGPRCKNPVFDGQVWTFREGPIAYLDASWSLRLLTQTCQVHETGDATDYEPTEIIIIRNS